MSDSSHRQWKCWASWSLTTSRRCTRKVLALSPSRVRAFCARGFRDHWRLLLVLVGFLVQAVLTFLMWQLVDLTIALMEVWAELARKHLELVLS